MSVRRAICLISCGFLVALVSGCGERQQSAKAVPGDREMRAAQIAGMQGASIDPASYSGNVAFKIDNELPTAKGPLPLVVYLGVAPENETRLRVNTFVDLRPMQTRLPEIVTGVVDETCERRIELDLQAISAESDAVRARGVVKATFYDCDDPNTLSQTQGAVLLSQTVDAEAVISGRLVNNCVSFELMELDLRPRGVLGAITDFLFSSEDTRSAVLKKVNAGLASHPVCPELPDELAALSPEFYSVRVQEIGEGGIGARMSGSLDISAPALIELLTAIKNRGLLRKQT